MHGANNGHLPRPRLDPRCKDYAKMTLTPHPVSSDVNSATATSMKHKLQTAAPSGKRGAEGFDGYGGGESSDDDDNSMDVKPPLAAVIEPGGGGGGQAKAGTVTGKKTKGRVKIKMEFIDDKLRRYTTFSKRKTGIMKKAYELSALTGTQVMLLVASETGHVYTFATRKLQPMITSDAGKALIQTCLNSPDPSLAASDQRMSATGYEETELTYNIADDE